MGELLETTMLICFGCSWPINLIKNYKCRSAKGMSLPFILLLIIGYIAGISAKLIVGINMHNVYVFLVYLLNLGMVTANLFVYVRNRALDRKAELCAKNAACDQGYAKVEASVSAHVQQQIARAKGAVMQPKLAGTAAYADPVNWGKSIEE